MILLSILYRMAIYHVQKMCYMQNSYHRLDLQDSTR